MKANRHLPLSAKSIVAVLLVLVCVMFFMEWANVAFRESGYAIEFVHYASRIVGLPVLTLLVWLIVREHGEFVRGLFSTRGITVRLIVTGLAVGILARVFWWSQITARVSFGWMQSSLDSPPQIFAVGFACPEVHIALMAILVWFFLVPFTEEFVHRGVLMSALSDRGPYFAIGMSALIFALSHDPESYLFVFLFGVIFGVLFWNVRSLWIPIIVHATYDGLQFIDWYCLSINWNPAPADLPLMTLGVMSSLVAVGSISAIAYLVSERWVGLRSQPNP